MGYSLRRFQFILKLSVVSIITLFVFSSFSQAGVPPINNECINALEVFNGVTPFDNFDATFTGPDFTCAIGFGSTDIWYEYTATCTGDVLFSLCDNTNFDTLLEMFDTDNCANLAGNSLNCNDQGCIDQSLFTQSVVEGDKYLVRIGGWFNAVGQGELLIEPQENCVLPTQDCSVTFVKSALPPDDTEFDFFENGFNLFSLRDPSMKSVTVGITEGNTLTVTEDVPLGWELTGVECEVTAPAINVSLVENGVELECVANGQATCTFSNQIAARPIPTLSEWSMIAVAVLLGAVGLIFAYRRRKALA